MTSLHHSIADDLIADILLAEQEARDDALLLVTAPDYGQFEDVSLDIRQAILRDLVIEGADINVVNKKNGSTPLCNAITRNEIDLVDCLLDLGAAIESNPCGNERHVAPLHLASWSNRTVMMNHLLSRGALVNHLDPMGANALFYAAASGAHEAMELLHSRGLTPKQKDHNQRTALCRIVMEDDVDPSTIHKLLAMHMSDQDMKEDIYAALSCLDDPSRNRQNRYMEAARYQTRSVLENALKLGVPIAP